MTGDKNLSFPPPGIFDDIIVVNNICGPLGALSCIFGRLSYVGVHPHVLRNFLTPCFMAASKAIFQPCLLEEFKEQMFLLDFSFFKCL